MKVIFFNWLASMGVEVSNMMALVIALGFIVLTSLILHVLLHRVLLVRLVTVLAKSKQVWLPPSCNSACSTGSPSCCRAPLCSVRRRFGCRAAPTVCS